MEIQDKLYEYNNPKNLKLIKTLSSFWGFTTFSFRYLPMLWFAGVRVKKITPNQILIKLPFRWSTKNPFRSVYFAAQAAAAEISTGLAFYFPAKYHGNISMLVKEMRVIFHKKATTDVVFSCDQMSEIANFVNRISRQDQGEEFIARSIGRDQQNNIVSEFEFTWTLKRRS